MRSAARAARWPASAMEAPLGIVAAAAGSAPGETGQEWLAVGRRFKARRPETDSLFYLASIELTDG